MSFHCLRCGACCRDLIIKFGKANVGLFLTLNEKNLFPSYMVSPMWAVGTKGRSRPRPEVKNYQLNVKDCPYITPQNVCRIYSHRPLICRAYPLSIHANPLTMKIEAASVDSKCKGCTDIPTQGTFQILGETFSDDILKANAQMVAYLAWMFQTPYQRVWLYDVLEKQWKEITTETVIEDNSRRYYRTAPTYEV